MTDPQPEPAEPEPIEPELIDPEPELMDPEPEHTDAVEALLAGTDLPDGWAGRATGPDRLTELAGWWTAVSASPAPAQVTLAWPADPTALDADAAPRCAARLVGADAAGRPADVAEAVAWGAAVADTAVDGGSDLIVLSLPDELVADALEAHVLLAAQQLQLDAIEATEWPSAETGLTDAVWIARVAGLRDERRRVGELFGAPERLLEAIGSPWLAAGAGLLARATARRTPVLLDGPAAAALGVLLRRTDPSARAWWQVADGGDRLHERVLGDLKLTPVLSLALGRRPGDPWLGGRLALSVLETACAAGAVES